LTGETRAGAYENCAAMISPGIISHTTWSSGSHRPICVDAIFRAWICSRQAQRSRPARANFEGGELGERHPHRRTDRRREFEAADHAVASGRSRFIARIEDL